MPAKHSTAAEGEKDLKKSKMEKGRGGVEEEGKKSVLFPRLWSDDDEITTLKGMLDYKEKIGADLMADANDFNDFVKKSLQIDVDRRQIVSKVRRLKKRYENSFAKRKSFNPNEKEVVELSKKIWGNHIESADLDQQSKSNMKTRKISKTAASSKSGGSTGMTSLGGNGSMVTDDGKKEARNSVQFIRKAIVSMGLDQSTVKVGLELCSDDRKAKIEEKWRKLHLEESDLYLWKLDLVYQGSEMIIAALKSGGN